MLKSNMIRGKYTRGDDTIYRIEINIFNANDKQDKNNTKLFMQVYSPFILNEDGGIDGYNNGRRLIGNDAINNFIENLITTNYDSFTHRMIGETNTLYLHAKDIKMLPTLENIAHIISKKVKTICNEINQLQQIKSRYKKISYAEISESYWD